ncbi:MAG TPA: class I SAM-dependent methyltransferase [Bryobacteraceae bacterium]|nr:class I SAM-dependent methyltransferase [Bryobacteraceae bacterium]
MSGLYEEVATQVPDPRLLFLNYGLVESDPAREGWIEASDRPWRLHLNLVHRVLAGVELGGRTVLEVGAGRGGNCLYLARYTQASSIWGVDRCESSVRLARRNCRGRRIHVIAGDAERLPFGDATVDLVLNIESAHCYAAFETFLAEVRRVLRPGGVFALADLWRLSVLPYDWDARERSLRRAGWEALREEDISEEVFLALRSEDGLSGLLLSLERPHNSELIRRIVQENLAMRLSLASGQCAYKIWQFRR